MKVKTQILSCVCMYVCACACEALDYFSRLRATLVSRCVNPLSLDCNAINHNSLAQFRSQARRINNHEERWLLTLTATSNLSHTVLPHTSCPGPRASNSLLIFHVCNRDPVPRPDLCLSLSVYLFMSICVTKMCYY